MWTKYSQIVTNIYIHFYLHEHQYLHENYNFDEFYIYTFLLYTISISLG